MHILWILVVIYISIQDASSAVLKRPTQPAVKSSCTACIYCLTHPRVAIIKTERQRTSIDRGVCPKSDTEEFYKLQQIEFMYRQYNKNAPCVNYCAPCRKNIIKTCRRFGGLKKSAWDMLYDGIFNKKPILDIKYDIKMDSKSKTEVHPSTYSSKGKVSDSSEIKPDDNNKGIEIPQKKDAQFKSSHGCCEISTRIVPYMGQIEESGVTWYAVWFKNPVFSYQLSQEANCSSYCSLVNTTRAFLFTTARPHPQYGHAYMLFNYYISNIKFVNDYIGGYCKKQVL